MVTYRAVVVGTQWVTKNTLVDNTWPDTKLSSETVAIQRVYQAVDWQRTNASIKPREAGNVATYQVEMVGAQWTPKNTLVNGS